jgi:hypothetical protein
VRALLVLPPDLGSPAVRVYNTPFYNMNCRRQNIERFAGNSSISSRRQRPAGVSVRGALGPLARSGERGPHFGDLRERVIEAVGLPLGHRR